MIVLDTTRRDVLRTFDSRSPLGDELAAFARDGVTLLDVRAPSSWTRTSVATLLTGIPATRHGVYDRSDVLPTEAPYLPEHLRRHGYRVRGFSANPNVLPVWGFDRGFESFVDVHSLSWLRAKGDVREVLPLVQAAVSADRRDPAFYYVHLMDPHAPYQPPPGQLHAASQTGAARRLLPVPPVGVPQAPTPWPHFQKYLGEVRDLDTGLGNFFDFLRREGVYEQSLILLVSDHGEEFLDHGQLWHGKTLYEEVLRVPAVLKLPGNRAAGAQVLGAVHFEDFVPTISAALGLEPPPETAGVNVLEGLPARPHLATLILDEHRLTSIADDGWKLIVDHVRDRSELYHLEQDPTERKDVAAEEPAHVDRLQRLLDVMVVRHQPGWHIRACGCSTEARITFLVATGGQDLRPLELEPSDRVAPLHQQPSDGGDPLVRVELDLTPTSAKREGEGQLVDVSLPDQDGILVRPRAGARPATPEDLSLQSIDGRPLRLAVAAGPVEARAGPVSLWALGEGALAAPSDVQECLPGSSARAPEGDTCEPFLRVYFVRPAVDQPEDELPPDVVDRLRALGYAW